MGSGLCQMPAVKLRHANRDLGNNTPNSEKKVGRPKLKLIAIVSISTVYKRDSYAQSCLRVDVSFRGVD